MARKKTPKKKVEVVFDTEKRKEFLTGFRKRKNERRTRAKAELTKNLKDERIRIRQEVKEGFKHLKKSYEPLKELTEADKAGEEKQETYEDDEVQRMGNMIGANTGEESKEEENQSESEVEDTSRPDRIPGMDYDPSARKRKAAPAAVEPKAKKPAHSDDPDIRSKKDLDKLMKTKTLKKMHKSKVFKPKERLDKQVNLKKAKRNHNNTIKSVPKHQRKKLKYGAGQPTVYSKGRKLNKKEIRRQRGD
ncbi:GL16315 [Drosophila persimilis]|uniref:Nucleolar protein 12 n=1 Tax=Drosophila persimilis TaxID=7234 RepID=B4HAC3_DROPE|nr:GL16315 [Drosophila persimilis]